MIDREPRGTDTKFDVGSRAGETDTTAAAVAVVSGYLDVQRPDTVFRIVSHLTVGGLSASRWGMLEATASTEPIRTLDNIATEFKRLADKWREDTEGYSSMTIMAAHDNYLAIVKMGWLAVPLILRELRDSGGSWYKALRVITGENPVTPEMAGDISRIDEAWLNWGRALRLI